MARKCKIASFFSGSRGIDQIKEIGNNMVKCSSAQEGGPCARIVTCQNNLNDAEIIPPRCLYLDEFRANETIDTELIYRIKKKNQEFFIQCGHSDLKLTKPKPNISFELVNESLIASKDLSECDKKIDCPVLGIIVIGKNPGKISEDEVKTFTDQYKQDSSLLYEGISDYWRNNWFHGVHVIPFYNNINWLLNYLNKVMPSLDLKQVLWTERIKCEFAKGISECFDSANECHRKYLKKELGISDFKGWPIICIGKDEFKFISFAYPDRIVIGLPHVTGAHGDAPKIYDYTKKDDQFENVRKSIVQWLDWRLSRRNIVELEKGNYTIPNARYFDLSSKFYDLPKIKNIESSN